MIQVRIDSEELTLSFEDWEARVRAGRIPSDAQILFEPATGDQWIRAEDLEMYTSLRNDAELAWRSQFITSGPPLLTALLVGVQVRLWWVQWWTPEAEGFLLEHLILFAPSVLENGEAWRLLTMGFAHTAAFHLALNMLWLIYCGWNLERALGRANLLLLYLASVVVGSLLSMYATPESPSLGASGGVYGLVAASVVYGFIRPNLLPEKGRRLFGWALMPYLVLMLGSGLMSEGIDNWSHLGGLLTGGALAAILDPPPLQRRPRWNQKIYAIATAGMLLAFVTFAVSGPRLVRLTDSNEARSPSRSGRVPPAIYQDRALQWTVPAGWRAGVSSTGEFGFTSPAGPRSWAVTERERTKPQTSELLRTAWLDRLSERWPDATTVLQNESTLAGYDALGVRATLTDETGEVHIVEWRGAARGLWTLESAWEVEQPREARLAPLYRRLLDRVEWSDPDELVSARIHYQHAPNSPRARDALATALARVGEVQAALAIRTTLIETHGDDIQYWGGMLEFVSWYPEATDPKAVWAQAMQRHPSGSIYKAVADSMEQIGQPELALGLLDLAWLEIPGDRSVRRARRSHNLSVELVGAIPWDVLYEPATGQPRTAADQERLGARPITMASIRARADLLAAQRTEVIQTVVAGIEAGDEAAILPALKWLRDGHTHAEAASIREDLERAIRKTRAPLWIDPAIVASLRQHGAPPPGP